MVSDPWQGKGVGALLLRHCLAIAERRGFENIFGIVKVENRNMLALGRKLGFTVEHMHGSTEYKLSKQI
jgi:acetyltransferase